MARFLGLMDRTDRKARYFKKLEDALEMVRTEVENDPSKAMYLGAMNLNPKKYHVRELSENLHAFTKEYGHVYINRAYLQTVSMEELVHTVKHEEAHVISGLGKKHGALWCKVVLDLEGELPEIYYDCKGCGEVTHSYDSFLESATCVCGTPVNIDRITMLKTNPKENYQKELAKDIIKHYKLSGKSLVVVDEKGNLEEIKSDFLRALAYKLGFGRA